MLFANAAVYSPRSPNLCIFTAAWTYWGTSPKHGCGGNTQPFRPPRKNAKNFTKDFDL